jgi:hypothetical protein
MDGSDKLFYGKKSIVKGYGIGKIKM